MENNLFSLSKLNEVSKGNDVFVRKMLTIFCEQTPQLYLEMESALTEADFGKVAKVAHQLKPSIHGLEIISLKQVIADLENAENYAPQTDIIHDKLAEFNAVTTAIIETIQTKYLSEP